MKKEPFKKPNLGGNAKTTTVKVRINVESLVLIIIGTWLFFRNTEYWWWLALAILVALFVLLRDWSVYRKKCLG